MLPSVRLRGSIANGIPRSQQNCDGRVHSFGGGRRGGRASGVRAVDGESLHQDRPGRTGRAAPRAHDVMVGPAPAAAWRRAADGNANGQLDDADETRASASKVEQAVLVGFALTVDGKRVVPAFDAPNVGLAGNEVGAEPVLGRPRRARPAPPGREHTLRIDDATPEPQLGETEIRVEESPATRLVASHRGPPDVDGAAARQGDPLPLPRAPSSPPSKIARSPSSSPRPQPRPRRRRAQAPRHPLVPPARRRSGRDRVWCRSRKKRWNLMLLRARRPRRARRAAPESRSRTHARERPRERRQRVRDGVRWCV